MAWSTDVAALAKSLVGLRNSTGRVKDIFEDPCWDPIAIRLARLLAHSMGRPGGGRLFMTFALLSFPPSVMLFYSDPQAPSLRVLGLWVVNCFGMLAIPYMVWRSLAKAGPALDELFIPSSIPSRTTFATSISKMLRNRWQILCGLGVGGSTAGLMVHEHASPGHGVLFALAYGYVGALVGSSGYLLIVTAILCRSLARSSHLRLNVLNPLDTMGLRLASDALRQLATWGLGLDFSFNFALALRYRATEVAQRNTEATIAAMIVGLGFLIIIGIQSQRWLAEPGAGAIRRQLDAIEHRIQPTALDSGSLNFLQRSQRPAASQAMRLYTSKLALKTSYVDFNLITAYSTAVFGVLLQLALSGIFGG